MLWDWRWKIENWDNFDKQPVDQPGDGESPRFGGYSWLFYLKDLGKKPRGLTSDNSWLKLTLCFALADGDGLESASKCFNLTNETYQQDIEMGVLLNHPF